LAVVMTGDLGKDPEAWSIAGHLTTKAKRDAIKKRMVDPDDSLAIVIVCDMWLTGTDIPCLHTLYIDKPMQGHTMIQAISRVNRVFRDKPHGLVVDYIGIGDDLRAATAKYTSGGGKGDPAPDMEAAKRVFLECLDALRATLPSGNDYAGWRKLGVVALEDLYAFVYGTLTETNDRQDAFLQAELRISSAFLLVKHLDECRGHADEIIFYQRVRKELEKTKAKAGKPRHEVEQAVRDLVDDSVDSDGVVDIFKVAGIERADISILDDHFLQTFKDKPHENLRLKLLEKLLHDEIQLRRRQNLAMARSFQEMLEKTLQKYHNRLIDAAAVIRALIQIRKDMEAEDGRANQLGLAAEELAFYDAVATNAVAVYGERFLCDLIHDVVKVIKSNLKVDWTEPHREDVKASIRAAVRRVLTNRKVKAEDFDAMLAKVMEQAEQLFGDWPKVA